MGEGIEVRELGRGDTRLAFEAMASLRGLKSEASFVARVDDVQRPEGYRLVGSFEEGGDACVAVAGFRVAHNLAWGKFLYVDDLSTLEARRGRGHAGALMGWLSAEAERLGCDQLHLDSGTERHAAHRFYLGRGMRITSFHFRLDPG
ncbi:GNAT family N-acetyltransferase [soil metagenome]